MGGVDGGWVSWLMALLFSFGSVMGDPGPVTDGEDPGVWMDPSSSPVGRQFNKEPRNPDCGVVFDSDFGDLGDEMGQQDPWACLAAQRDAGLGGLVTQISDPSDNSEVSVTTYYVLSGSGRLRVYTEAMDYAEGSDEWTRVQCRAPHDLSTGCSN